jgi:hypothetical protein
LSFEEIENVNQNILFYISDSHRIGSEGIDKFLQRVLETLTEIYFRELVIQDFLISFPY